jgi:hypothetical protein
MIMKTPCIILSLLALGAVAPAGAFGEPYDDSKPPALSLPAAYERAWVAMGARTNHFHCVSANITTNFSPEGQWAFLFCTTNKPTTSLMITVDFRGEDVRVHRLPPLEVPKTSLAPPTGLKAGPPASSGAPRSF